MRKLFAAAATIIMCILALTLSACGKTAYAGSDRIEELRTKAASYDSGRYYVENADTGAVEQVISFFYDGEGREVYLREELNDAEYTAEYSDGIGLWRMTGTIDGESDVFALKDKKSVKVDPSDDSFAVYTKKSPGPYASGCLFFYVNGYILTASETADNDGNTVYAYVYDTEKINKELGSYLSEFSTAYAFDKNGDFLYFLQHNISADSNGETGVYGYKITLEDINSITDIENPCAE